METFPMIYVLHGSDVQSHTEAFSKILINLQSESRISGYTFIPANQDLTTFKSNVHITDFLVVMLSSEIELQLVRIMSIFNEIKTTKPGVRIAEVIIDNIPYEDDYLVFPKNLQAIRLQKDMDGAWAGVQKDLQDLLPKRSTKKKKFPYLILGGVAAAILLLLVFIVTSGAKPTAMFSYKLQNSGTSNPEFCYAGRCMITFTNTSKEYDTVEWKLGDSVSNVEQFSAFFLQPGTVEITLTAFAGKKKSVYSKKINVKQGPVAEFRSSVQDTNCEGPCAVTLINRSKYAMTSIWVVDDISFPANKVDTIMNLAVGAHTVKLIAINEDNVADTATDIVDVVKSGELFADFEINYLNTTANKMNFQFKSKAKNETSVKWTFNGGTPSESTLKDEVVGFPRNHVYQVELKALNGNNAVSKIHTVNTRRKAKISDIFKLGNNVWIYKDRKLIKNKVIR